MAYLPKWSAQDTLDRIIVVNPEVGTPEWWLQLFEEEAKKTTRGPIAPSMAPVPTKEPA